MSATRAAEQPSEAPVTVAVVSPFQVVHEGTVYGPGDTATVPADVAAFWTANGWATE